MTTGRRYLLLKNFELCNCGGLNMEKTMKAEQIPEFSSIPELLPSIPEVFEGKCVLVTGATGFIGKVLVEKLLRSCPGIRKLYILLRASEKGSVTRRFDDFIRHSVFDRLRKDRADALQKITALTGDVTEAYLGLNHWQFREVIVEVSFIFHCAANVRLNDEPRNTMNTNLLGVHNLLNFCDSCLNLEAIVHVSVAFAVSRFGKCAEMLYPEIVSPQKIIQTLRWMTNDQFRTVCMYYFQDGLDTYHFSKALAETLIHEWRQQLPVIIVRPSIVTASVNEPFPGWIENSNGPSGFLAECEKGIVRTLLVKDNVNADWVPVDTVANTLIAAAHHMVIRSKLKNSSLKITALFGVPIINCTCAQNNLITWMKVIEICRPFLVQYPSMQVYGRPGCTATACLFQYNFYRLMSHYIPAVLIDAATCLTLRKPRMICHYKSIHRDMSHLEYYTTNPFISLSDSMQKLTRQMSPEDKELFPIGQSKLDWTVYAENYALGVRRFLLKEKDETLTEARTKMMRIHYSWLVLKLSSMFGIFLFIHALKKRGYIFFPRLLLPSFQYITSAIASVQRKLISY